MIFLIYKIFLVKKKKKFRRVFVFLIMLKFVFFLLRDLEYFVICILILLNFFLMYWVIIE